MNDTINIDKKYCITGMNWETKLETKYYFYTSDIAQAWEKAKDLGITISSVELMSSDDSK